VWVQKPRSRRCLIDGRLSQVDQQFSNKAVTNLFATLIGDEIPEEAHGVSIIITFACGFFSNKCCVDDVHTSNAIGNQDGIIPPHTEPIECIAGKDVSGQNCDTAVGGWCTFHVVQYQKWEGPGLNTDNYRFDVTLYDADGVLVGDVEQISVPSEQTQQIATKPLQYTLALTAPNVDDDPIKFAYADQSWDTNDESHCKMGAYDSGSRQGDCGFTCSQ
jgi:hypothetical protein